MSYGVKLKVWGDFACFTRPEMKVERVSYEVMTPSAARGILEAIYWKPSIRWIVDRIHVLNPVRFCNIRRNEVASKIPMRTVGQAMKDGKTPLELFIEDDRQQRASLILRDVAYIIEAHFEFTGEEDRNPAKHKEAFERRASKGQCFHQPCLGCREFPAHFELLVGPPPRTSRVGETDLGLMLHDIDFSDGMRAFFFHARMVDGVMEIPRVNGKEVIS